MQAITVHNHVKGKAWLDLFLQKGSMQEDVGINTACMGCTFLVSLPLQYQGRHITLQYSCAELTYEQQLSETEQNEHGPAAWNVACCEQTGKPLLWKLALHGQEHDVLNEEPP